MTYRNPQYAWSHVLREIGSPNIIVDEEDPLFPVSNMYDNRFGISPVFKFQTSIVDHKITADMIFSRAVSGHDRMYIPSGHNLDGATITVEEDVDEIFSTPVELLAPFVVPDDGIIDRTFDTAQVRRYLRVRFPTTAGIWEIPQLMITKTITTTQGPDPDWVDELIPNVLQFPTGDTVEIDRDQHFVEYSYPTAGRTASDLTDLELLISSVSTLNPFLLDTAYQEDDGGYTAVMKLSRGAASRGASPAPVVQSRRADIRLSMLEHLA